MGQADKSHSVYSTFVTEGCFHSYNVVYLTTVCGVHGVNEGLVL